MRTGQVSKLVKSGVFKHLGGNMKGGDPRGLEYRIAEWIVDRYKIDTVLDLGSAEGHMVEYFQQLECQAIGLDGLPRNAEVSETPTIVWDLTQGGLRIDKIDLVWCVEVVEHIAEEFVTNLLDTMCNGRIIVMSHAYPRQEGWHHVNCKNSKYWVDRLTRRGYHYERYPTRMLKRIGKGFLKERGMVFRRLSGKWRR